MIAADVHFVPFDSRCSEPKTFTIVPKLDIYLQPETRTPKTSSCFGIEALDTVLCEVLFFACARYSQSCLFVLLFASDCYV